MSMHPAVILHDQKARDWEQLYARPFFKARVATILELLAGKLDQGALWLDAGCGSGFLSRQLAERGCIVTGMDASPTMIQVARELTQPGRFAHPPQFELVTTLEHVGRGDASFSGVLCSSVLEYMDDPANLLREFARVVRPGGCLLLTVPNRSSLFRRLESLVFWVTKTVARRPWPAYRAVSKHQYTRLELSALLAAGGFRAEAFAWFGPVFAAGSKGLPLLGMLTAVRAVRQ